MSEDERRNLNEKGCDDKQDSNLEVRDIITASNSTTHLSRNSSEIADHNLQCHAAMEVDSNTTLSIKELSHEPRGEIFSEKPECKVISEFPSDDKCGNGSCSGQTCGLFCNTCHHTSGYNQSCTITRMKEQNSMPIEAIDAKNLLNEDKGDIFAVGISKKAERKRKNDFSLMENKRQKKIESSDRFDDAEDIVKDTPLLYNCDWSSSVETAKQMPVPASDIQANHARQKELANEDKSVQILKEQSSSGSNSFHYSQSKDNTAGQTSFLLSLKGETVPLFKLSDENKEKFKLSMPTIFEVRESERQSKSNPLKMKKKVGKRKDKCNVCNVRLGLCAIQCRCGGYYCPKHRYDREHNCTYDYRSMGAAEIEKNNPKIVAMKVSKL